MLRYLKLYIHFVKFSFSKAMEFRLDFFFRVLMDLFYYLVNIAFYRIIFLHTSLLGGWGEAQMMVFVGSYLVVDALNMTFVGNNMWWLPIFINRGDLDYYLVRPVSSLFFLSLRDFAANSFVNLLMAVAILIWAIYRYPAPIAPGNFVLFTFLIVNGAFLYYLVHILLIIPVFWTHSPRGLDNVFYSLTPVVERPDRIFTGWVRKVLTTVLPFCLMASFPARLLMEKFDWVLLLHIVAITAVFFLIVVKLWNLALRSYSSASS